MVERGLPSSRSGEVSPPCGAVARLHGTVIVQIAAKLEVHVELNAGCVMPIVSGLLDARGQYWRTGVCGLIDRQHLGQNRCLRIARNADHFRHHLRIVLEEETAFVRLVALISLHLPQLGQLFQPSDNNNG